MTALYIVLAICTAPVWVSGLLYTAYLLSGVLFCFLISPWLLVLDHVFKPRWVLWVFDQAWRFYGGREL